jgi:hypothetical protein
MAVNSIAKVVWGFLIALLLCTVVSASYYTIAIAGKNASSEANSDLFNIMMQPTILVVLISALLAAVGYVINIALNWQASRRKVKAERVTNLVKLQSLLQASNASFQIQRLHARNLLKKVNKNHPGFFFDFNRVISNLGEYELNLSKAYPIFLTEEKELHEIIRSITINSLYPINKSFMDWLKEDTYFKAQWQREDIHGDLAKQLSQLDAHLILWISKYRIWITPKKPEHALVYMADEAEHGVVFPSELNETVKILLEEKSEI